MSHQYPPADPAAGETVAAWLEQIAAQLRTLPANTTPLSINVSIQPFRVGILEGEAPETVHAVAAALGLVAEPRETPGGTWHLHAGREEPGDPGGCWLRTAVYCTTEAPTGGDRDE